MADEVKFSVGRVTRFYVPLLLQGFTQSLSYPLVAGVITHGAQGVNGLTAFSQGQMVMFLVGSLGAGLVTTGLVFAGTWKGYTAFRRLNAVMMVILLALQCLPAVAPFNVWLFEGFFHLPHELAEVARWTLLFGVVMNAGFIIRNPPMVALLNNLQSVKANNATMLRIVLTLVLAFAATHLGFVGPAWGLVVLTLGVWAETLVTWLYARPYVRKLQQKKENAAPAPQSGAAQSADVRVWEQLRFTVPLVIGYFLLAFSPLITAAFVARSANATDMLALHYVLLGVVTPVMFGALRLQTVSVKFQPEYPGDRRLLGYAVVAGLVLGLIPILFATPLLSHLYFGVYQNLPDHLMSTARIAIAIYAVICVIQTVRARIEGIAAARKRSDAVMAGQITYTVALFCICAALWKLGASGIAIAMAGVILSPLFVIAAIYAALAWKKKGNSSK